MKESEFQQQIIDYAHLNGWRVAHFRSVRIQREDGSYYYATPVQADGEGFPDLVLIRPPRLVFAEVKVSAKVSPKQEIWLQDLRDCGMEVYVWRPTDWAEIERVL